MHFILRSDVTLPSHRIREEANQVITPYFYSGALKEHLYIVTDQDLTLLNIYAHRDFYRQEGGSLARGISLIEECCGINAFMQSKKVNRIIVVERGGHHIEPFHLMWSAAGPIRDLNRKIVGYLGLFLPQGKESASAIGLLKALIEMIEIKESERENRSGEGREENDRKGPASSLLDLIGEAAGDRKRVLRSFTRREMEILPFLLKRWTNQEIARELHLSLSTVRKHRQNIFQKVDVHSIQELLSAFGLEED